MEKYNDDIYPIDDVKELYFDINKLRSDLIKICKSVEYKKGLVCGISLTRPVDDSKEDPRGIFWTKPNASGKEEQREGYVDESVYTKFLKEARDTYYYEVYQALCKHYKIGRVRILKLKPRTSLSWHRDPEPRIHIPILTNPGALVVVENFATNMPANGSTYFMNTIKYHNAINGGEEDRIHLVATVLS
jgi:hypothetical protein